MPIKRVQRKPAPRKRIAEPDDYLDQDEEEFDSDEEDEEEEERPARRSARRAPAKPTRRVAKKAAPARRGRVVDDDEDEEEDDERPARRPSSSAGRSGWGSWQKEKKKNSAYADELRLEEEAQLIKFLDAEPFHTYHQHWVPRAQGKMSWICRDAEKGGCPLCDSGDDPRVMAAFNIVLFSEDGDEPPENKVLTVGVKAGTQLQNFSEDKITGPLTKLYWAVSKSGKKQKTTYSFVPVKERDLGDDYGIEPLSKEELRDLKQGMFGPDAFKPPSRNDLKALVREATDEDDDEDYDDD